MNLKSESDWISELENRKPLIIGGVILITIFTLFVTALQNPVSLDSYWHLQMGKDWVENGLSPWLDHYSFTYSGKEISNPPVLFQVFLYFMVSMFGLTNGYLAVKVLGFLMVVGAAVTLLQKMRAPVLIYAFVLLIVAYFLQLRVLVRPELFSYVFTVIALIIYFRAENKITLSTVLPILVLMLIWTNYHRSSIVGYVIFSGFYLDYAINQFRANVQTKNWSGWLVSGILIVLVGFLNPAFGHPILESLSFSPDWKHLIAEYSSYPGLMSARDFVFVGILTLLAIFMTIRYRQYGFLFITSIMIYAAIEAPRMIVFSGIVITILLAQTLVDNDFLNRCRAGGKRIIALTGLTSLLLFIVLLIFNVGRVQTILGGNRADVMRQPVALVNYLRSQEVEGKVFNIYGVGGYLIYQLSPEIQVYIDGRTDILYPIEHMKTFLSVTRSSEALIEELDKYGVDRIIWTIETQEMHDLVTETGEFHLEFMDAVHVYYVRGGARFQLLGQLMTYPGCWQQEMASEIESELLDGRVVLPQYSRLIPFAGFLDGYTKAVDKMTFLENSVELTKWSDEMIRFAIFRFEELDRGDIALALFSRIEELRPQDYAVAAMLALKAENPEIASKLLLEFSGKAWLYVSKNDLRILEFLYSKLAETRSLNHFEVRSKANLTGVLAKSGLTPLSGELEPGLFCPEPGLKY